MSASQPQGRLTHSERHRGIPNSEHEAARTSTACFACRERKVKCSGDQPCRFCHRRKLECVFAAGERKKMYSVSYVKELEKRSMLQGKTERELQLRDDSREIDDFVPNQDTHVEQDDDRGGGTSSTRLMWAVDQVEDSNPSNEVVSQSLPLVTGSAMSSSINFSFQIKSLPVSSNLPSSHVGELAPQDEIANSPDNAFNLMTSDPHRSESPILWPTEAKAHGLLDTVCFSIGRVQHLFEPRSFSDHLEQTYASGIEKCDTRDLWFVKMLLVFAIGELLQGEVREGSDLPGSQYFLHAIHHLPNLCTLRSLGTQAVEVMGLVAFYLQCSDRKDDAYIYACNALRLAILSGMSREPRGGMMRSEKNHRNRLWWTIYMQERRLAAAAGLPMSIDDDSIRIGLPIETPGFIAPTALIVNIKIARLTGQITKSLYSQKARSEQEFTTTVQDILTSLSEIGRDMPPEYALDFSKPFVVTRTSATLYLMLYQATVLATRPILFHLASSSFGAKDPNVFSAASSSRQKLANTCIEAARRSLLLVKALKEQQLIAKFGCFDLDAIFSIAFIFVLAERITKGAGCLGIEGAQEMFQYLTAGGNKAAENRRVDILQMCENLGLFAQPTTGEKESEETQPENHPQHQKLAHKPTLPAANHQFAGSEQMNNLPIPQPHYQAEQMQPFYNNDESFETLLDHNNMMNYVPNDGLASNQVWDGSYDIYSCYYNDEFALTGAMETDWEELQRQIGRYQ